MSAMARIELREEQLTRSIIGAFFDVFNALDFGFLEQVYVGALECELRERGHRVDREVAVSVRYKGRPVAMQRIDMIVDRRVVVEAKATRELHPIASRQLYAYLRASTLDVGLLLHFGPKPTFRRVICRHEKRSE
jgi:GxxExxY protein